MGEKGFYAYSMIKDLVDKGALFSSDPSKSIREENIQPASYEPRLSNRIYVSDIIDPSLRGAKVEDLYDGFVLRRDKCYTIPLIERLALPSDTGGIANPKSRSGRAGLNVRLFAEGAGCYDHIPFGYSGPLFLEITSRAFDYIVSPEIVLNQIRFANASMEELQLSGEQMKKYLSKYRIRDNPRKVDMVGMGERGLVSFVYDFNGEEIQMDKIDFSGDSLVLHHSNTSPNDSGIVAYRAKKNSGKPFDLRGKVNNASDFFEPVYDEEGEMVATPHEFFLSSSAEILHCPEDLIMVTRPFDPRYGDMKGDHAGFIDPGFFGTLTFEPVVYESLPMRFREGQAMMGLRLAPLIGESDKKYGENNVHQGQMGVKLGPFFEAD